MEYVGVTPNSWWQASFHDEDFGGSFLPLRCPLCHCSSPSSLPLLWISSCSLRILLWILRSGPLLSIHGCLRTAMVQTLGGHFNNQESYRAQFYCQFSTMPPSKSFHCNSSSFFIGVLSNSWPLPSASM
ncbi:hypothetical protein JTE90_003624 [Oedothorax gibbosus]|uniref:Uncharacterized protein n=1 Tax=Oedothorax gibbosus TaxID=931172 RepID=A0AAV6U0P7_9ARAC|nr:hypothetical protein JTE90_003624 [Oedothorax gibbosus]